MVENGEFLNSLRNGHLEKSAVTGICSPSCSPTTAKTPAKVHLRLRFQNLGKPRTAGLCGRAAGACDCGPLSCAKIERPSPLEKPSCKVRLFVQKRSRKYRQKVTVTTLFPTVSHCVFQLLAQMAHVCLHSESGYTLGSRRRIAHSGLHAETGGVSDGGGITTLGAFRTFTNIPGPGIRTAHFAALGAWSGALPKNTESLRNSDALMRVAVPQASRPRWAAQPLLWSSWLSCFCLKPLLQTALRHGTMVSPNRNP